MVDGRGHVAGVGQPGVPVADMTWLAWHPWLLNLLTHVCVLWEVSFCVLIWRPRLRPLMLAGAVLLHVGIGACLGMWTFALIMLVGCTSFLPRSAACELLRVLQAATLSRLNSRAAMATVQESAWGSPSA